MLNKRVSLIVVWCRIGLSLRSDFQLDGLQHSNDFKSHIWFQSSALKEVRSFIWIAFNFFRYLLLSYREDRIALEYQTGQAVA